MVHPRRRIKHTLLTLNGYIGRTSSLDIPKQVTVLLTYFHPARMNYIDSQVRNFLKCSFVERIVISNHNPDIRIEDKLYVRDDRLICINQPIRRFNGYRWRVASKLDGEYFVVIDDDVLLFPSQLKVLLQHLISEPAVPHGFSGAIHLPHDEFQYRERENLEVTYLYELYAVTKHHVKRYAEMERLLSEQDTSLSEFVERFADHIVISRTAARDPRIHKVSRLLRNETFKTPGIATHKNAQFEDAVLKVCHAVSQIQRQNCIGNAKIH